MAIDPRNVVPTRSALLELKDEHRFVREGLDLLDQKRMLLAGELLRWLARHDLALAELRRAHDAARRALADAVARHGIEELGAYPVTCRAGRIDRIEASGFLGVPLVLVRALPPEPVDVVAAGNPSPEARRAATAFGRLLDAAVALAGPEANLRRLFDEYRRTERRARALENVILPELGASLGHVEEALDEQDQEEALRARLAPTTGR